MGHTDVRQPADTAVKLLESGGKDMVGPMPRRYLEAVFKGSIEQGGELSVEFMQGFFSACLFIYTSQKSLKGIVDTLADFKDFAGATTFIAAEQYLATIEKELKK